MNTLIRNGADITHPRNVGRWLTYDTLANTICSSLTQDGATPLHIASQNGHSDIVNTLIRNGAAANEGTLYLNPLLLVNKFKKFERLT